MSRFMKDRKNTKEKGDEGERHAASFLESEGFLVLDRNVRERFGEVDIVAAKDGVIHFIEVKSSFSSNDMGWNPAEKVTPRKLRHIASVAGSYMERSGQINDPWSIDVVVVYCAENGAAQVELIPVVEA